MAFEGGQDSSGQNLDPGKQCFPIKGHLRVMQSGMKTTAESEHRSAQMRPFLCIVMEIFGARSGDGSF